MNDCSFPRRSIVRKTLALAAIAGLVLLLSAATMVPAAENTKAGAFDDKTAKDQKALPAKESMPSKTVPAADFGPQGPPRDDGQGQPKSPRPERQPGGPNRRQPGNADDRQREGQPIRPGSFGPGQPLGDPPRGMRPDWPWMERRDPEIEKLIKSENELDRRTHEAAEEYREAPEDQRARLKENLEKLVTQQFESRQQRRKVELKRFDEELKRLRDATDRRDKNKQQIIEKRVSDLLGEPAEPGF